MEELVTVEQAGAIVATLAWAGPVAGIIVGIIAGAMQGKAGRGAIRGLAIGALGPVIWALWLVFKHLVRYNPQTGHAGLHSISTLVVSVLIFVVVGIALGAFYGRIVFVPEPEESEDPTANRADNDTHQTQ